MKYEKCEILTWLLSERVINMDVHWSVDSSLKGGAVHRPVLVAAFNRLGLPVGPVDVIFKHCDGEHMVELQIWSLTCTLSITLSKYSMTVVLEELLSSF